MSTELLFVLDRSGSMGSLHDRTIMDVNELINKYRSVPNAFMSLIQFDDNYEPNYIHRPVSEVVDLNRDTYQPRGSTALYDAICKTIDEAGQKFSQLPTSERENLNVVMAVFTDGFENASKEFKNPEEVRRRIKHQQDKYGWEFIFMGADENGILAAGQMGFSHANTVKMSNNPVARQYTMDSFGGKLGAYGLAGAQGPVGPVGKSGLSWNAVDREEANK